MGFMEEYNKLKKKRKDETESKSSNNSFMDEYQKLKEENPIMEYSGRTSPAFSVSPTIDTITVNSDSEKDDSKENKKWYQSGEFEDGYQFGDIAKTILGAVKKTSDELSNDISPYIHEPSWVGNKVMAGVNAFNKSVTGTADVLLGKPLQELGWKDNPISSANNLYSNMYDSYNQKAEEIAKENGYGVGHEYLGEAIESTVAAVPNAILALMTAGSSLGATTGDLATKAAYEGGNLLTKSGLTIEGMMKDPQYWLSFAQTYGSDYEEAKSKGADDATAAIGSTISSLINAGIEIGFDGASGIQGLPEKVKQGDKNAILEWVKSSIEEGNEEVLQDFVSNIVSKTMYDKDTELANLEDMAKDWSMGATVGAVLGGGQMAVQGAINSTQKAIQTHEDSKLTENEQKVVDKVVQDRIEEAQKKGDVSNKEKTKIRNEVVNDLKKGYISTDTIEEVLGGETYKSYRETVDNEDALLKEYEELINLKKSDLTVKQDNRIKELEKQIFEFTNNDSRNKLKEQLGYEVSKMVIGDRLSESYNERIRRSQGFESDLTKYDAKQRKVVQNAIDSGILNNTNKTHEFVDMIAKISADKGVPFNFTNNAKLKESGFAIEGKTINGIVTNDGVALNIQSSKSLNSVVGHEITHVLEGTDFYDELQQTLFEYAKSRKSKDSKFDSEYKERLYNTRNIYKNVNGYEGVEGFKKIKREVAADLVGDYLFTDEDFVNNLSANHRNVFQKIYDEIKYLYKVATAGSEEARELEKVKRAFDKAYREGGKAQAETKYSISDKNIKDISNGYGYGETYYTMSYTQDGKIVATLEYGEYDGEPNVKMIEVDPEYRRKGIATKLMQELQKKYPDSEINFGMRTPDGAKLLDSITYDVTDESVVVEMQKLKDLQTELSELQEKLDILYDTENLTEEQDAELHELGDRWQDVYESIHELSNNLRGKKATRTFVKMDTKYSLSDSDGNQLSEAQQEYFKDSKVRDENGNLKVMYHGTSNGGHTIFEPYGKAKYGLFGLGTYFTDNRSVAESYTQKGKGNNPKVYESYLNIKNPMDMDAAADPAEWAEAFPDAYFPKSGTNEDFYRAMEEYFEDEMLSKWEAAETAMEAIEGMGYDGITHIGGGRFNKADDTRHRVYIAFEPEQIKNIDNTKPTSDPDIRFSLSEPVEETKDLIALHNVREDKLMDALRLGGLPSPSIAITKSDIVHDNYGSITMILSKDSIDPQADSRNKVYGSDAWTPTSSNARTEYEVKYDKMRNFEAKISDLSKQIAGGAFSNGSVVQRLGIEDVTDNNAARLAERLANFDEVRAAYLSHIGKSIEPEYKKKVYNKFGNKALQTYIDRVGVQHLASVIADSQLGEMAAIRAEEETVRQIIRDHYAEKRAATLNKRPELKESRIDKFMENNVSVFTIEDFVKDAWKFYEEGGAVTEEIDRLATSDKLREAANTKDVIAWLEPQIEEFLGEPGIYNGQDLFDARGNRKSFAQTHYTYTAENIVKAMQQVSARGETYGEANANTIIATATPSYNSISEIHADKGRLKVEDKEVYDQIIASIDDSLKSIERDIMRTTKHHADNTYEEGNIIGSIIAEAATGNRTVTGVRRTFAKEDYRISEEQAKRILHLYDQASTVPTGYFEAKPERVVGFDEVAVVVIPYDADTKLKQELLNNGLSIAEYDPNVEGDRQRVVNQFEEYRFSLSDASEPPKTYGNYNVYGKDIALEEAPIRRTTPVQKTVAETKTAENVLPDDYAPVTDEESAALQRDRLDSLLDSDVPPEIEAPYSEEASSYVKPEDPFTGRNIDAVGNRKVKAYMYENPEVKPFFQAEAQNMLSDLHNSIKGERWYNDELYYSSNGEKGWGGTKRHTTDDIAFLLDNYHYTYEQIEKGLNAIIEDNGAENNAVSKRIEFMLDDRLRNGYTAMFGEEIPAEQDYINFLNEKQITEYSKEAFDKFMETADDYAPPVSEEDIAPVAVSEESTVTENASPMEPQITATENVAPTYGSKNGVIEGQQKMWNTKVLTEEPKVQKKKSRAWSKFKANFLDKGSVFEDLSLKTKNRELMGKWNYILSSESRAQRMIGNGSKADGVKSLNDIRSEVEKTGKTKQFYEYLYHKHNVDRMQLADRYKNTPNKPVFGEAVTAEASQELVDQYESKNPEFKEYAKDVYDYMNHLRKLMVDNGVISQETSDLWDEMYPHYVPIRRAGDTGIDINVPLDSRRTGINAPVKRATGGSRDILPLFDTMAMRTQQTYKAIAKNRFGVELKNTLGTIIANEAANVDEVIDSVDSQDGLLQEGKNGQNPTFTVFENGKKVTFEITEDMYDALKPTSEGLAYTSKIASTVSNLHRGLLTEYNPVFMATNAIKDAQDVLVNSQHPARTYAQMPKAAFELIRKGSWYNEYLDNGGEQNTYFDKDTNTFEKEKSTIRKVVGMPLDVISKLNNGIEMLPRLAEYMASRKAGRSAEVSMLDAARVTTNFAAGGDVTKFLNRNGATFLNASVQGAVQQVRNVREAKANGLKGWVNLAAKFAVAGLPAILLNNLLWDDDDEYDDLSDYVKQNYYVVAKYGDGKFVRIPKGRALAVIQNAFEQISNAATGNDEVDLASFLELAVSNLAPNNPIDNNIISPIIQVSNNKTWYGDDLVPKRLQDLPQAEQFDESTDEISKWLGEKLNYSPYKINYLLNQYSGGIGDVALPMITPESERESNSFTDDLLAPLMDKFTTDSVMKNQNISNFYDTMDKLTTNAKSRNATDEDVLKYKYFNSVNDELSELYAQKREIQNSNLSDDEKYSLVREIQKQIVDITKESLNSYNDVFTSETYAKIADRQYMKTDDGEWKKITDKQLEKQDKVTNGLGISASDYWGNKAECDFAYDNPEKYAVAKSVGGYNAYKAYTNELYDIKADKDSNGKTISGSRKEKVINYIDNLDADYGEKIILFKSEYPSDDTYNYEIIDYLNSRNDISYEEMETILKELGFTVLSDGSVRW